VKQSEKLLLIDTTKEVLFVALVGANKVEVRTNPERRRHSETLNEIVGDWCRVVDAYAVVTGPGSWTGSRVGVVAVKGWAFALGKPVIALGAMDDNDELVLLAKKKFVNKDFTDVKKLAPYYDSEFKVTPPKK